VPTLSGSCSEIYLEKAFTSAPFACVQGLPVARELGATALMFHVYPTLEDEHVNWMAETLAGTLATASRGSTT
jgi:dTDP-4-amino-4,6-dideoxygalactose transaminase